MRKRLLENREYSTSNSWSEAFCWRARVEDRLLDSIQERKDRQHHGLTFFALFFTPTSPLTLKLPCVRHDDEWMTRSFPFQSQKTCNHRISKLCGLGISAQRPKDVIQYKLHSSKLAEAASSSRNGRCVCRKCTRRSSCRCSTKNLVAFYKSGFLSETQEGLEGACTLVLVEGVEIACVSRRDDDDASLLNSPPRFSYGIRKST